MLPPPGLTHHSRRSAAARLAHPQGKNDGVLSWARAAKAGCELAPATAPEGLEIATVAGGCFWGLELAYQRLPGVRKTSVGYTAGKASAGPHRLLLSPLLLLLCMLVSRWRLAGCLASATGTHCPCFSPACPPAPSRPPTPRMRRCAAAVPATPRPCRCGGGSSAVLCAVSGRAAGLEPGRQA